jgi:mono/diheme cytochrome c family protein
VSGFSRTLAYTQAMRSILVAITVLTCVVAMRAQNTEPRIWQGVYSAAQAERGKTSYNSSCLRCHGDNLQGNTAPALSSDRFFTTWGGEPIASLFAKIRDTMPPNFGTSIDDQVKLDIVAYILRTNGYPSGAGELTQTGSDLATAQILKKGEQALVQNFSLVQTVGCLSRGPDNTWILTRTADPLVTRDDVPSSQSLASAAGRPLGTRTFRLLSTKPFDPESHQGHKMEARGLIYDEPGDERLTLTSLKMAGNCTE